jgi:hypothetical protein
VCVVFVSEGDSTTTHTHTSFTSGSCWWWGSGVCSDPGVAH